MHCPQSKMELPAEKLGPDDDTKLILCWNSILGNFFELHNGCLSLSLGLTTCKGIRTLTPHTLREICSYQYIYNNRMLNDIALKVILLFHDSCRCDV